MAALLDLGVSNALMATVLALIAATVSSLGRRPALAHALWLLVLLKLVTPPLVLLPLNIEVNPEARVEAVPREAAVQEIQPEQKQDQMAARGEEAKPPAGE